MSAVDREHAYELGYDEDAAGNPLHPPAHDAEAAREADEFDRWAGYDGTYEDWLAEGQDEPVAGDGDGDGDGAA